MADADDAHRNRIPRRRRPRRLVRNKHRRRQCPTHRATERGRRATHGRESATIWLGLPAVSRTVTRRPPRTDACHYYNMQDYRDTRPEFIAVRVESPTSTTVQTLTRITSSAGGTPLAPAWAWNSDLAEAYATIQTGQSDVCQTIAYFTRGTWSQLHVRVGSATTGWYLDDSAHHTTGNECNPAVGTTRSLCDNGARTIHRRLPCDADRNNAPARIDGRALRRHVPHRVRFINRGITRLQCRFRTGRPLARRPATRMERQDARRHLGRLHPRSTNSSHHAILRRDLRDIAWSPDGHSLAALDTIAGSVTVFDEAR